MSVSLDHLDNNMQLYMYVYLFVRLNWYLIGSTPHDVVMSIWVFASTEPVQIEGGSGAREVEDLT